VTVCGVTMERLGMLGVVSGGATRRGQKAKPNLVWSQPRQPHLMSRPGGDSLETIRSGGAGVKGVLELLDRDPEIQRLREPGPDEAQPFICQRLTREEKEEWRLCKGSLARKAMWAALAGMEASRAHGAANPAADPGNKGCAHHCIPLPMYRSSAGPGLRLG
jgi:hypothetical protein